MDSGFRLEHFDLLAKFGGERRTKSPAERLAYDRLVDAYRCTQRWAEELQRIRFPDGSTRTIKAPLNRGTWFWPYNWARIWPDDDAPKQLCYTVGIDASGHFIVKVDTASVEEPWRQRYLSMLFKTYSDTPFVVTLPAERGLAMTLEELVEWSIGAIDGLDVGYAEVARRIGLPWRGLRRLDLQSEIRFWFERWRDAMLEYSNDRKGIQWLPDCRVVIREGAQKDGRFRFELGDDPTGARWSVQINEPLDESGYNPPSAIGVDEDGHHFLIHQGLLRNADGTLFDEPEFGESSGFRTIPVQGTGLAAKRTWYVVAPLDAASDRIRASTAAFAGGCARVRGWAEAGPLAEDGFDFSEESGENYFTHPDDPHRREVERRQGMVWLKLKQVLQLEGLTVCKTIRHPRGFQVDALIGRKKAMKLLVEIKTSISAGDIHTGVGQLHLYPKLITSAVGLKPILLLPGRPHDDVLRAIGELQIAAHFYEFGDGSKEGITFSDDFLAECRSCPEAKV